jgi:hypothetical protein
MRINESEFPLKDGSFGKIAVFMYGGSGDPREHLIQAISKYTEDVNGVSCKYFELIDAQLDNPWVRVVISGINQMDQFEFDPDNHRMISISDERNDKLKEIGI